MPEYLMREKVFSGGEHDGQDWPTHGYPGNLIQLIAWFQGKLELVPEEFRAAAACELTSEHYYDSDYVAISIWYYRPETDEESAERIAEQRAKSEGRRAHELATLEALKLKYPDA